MGVGEGVGEGVGVEVGEGVGVGERAGGGEGRKKWAREREDSSNKRETNHILWLTSLLPA